MDTSSAETGLIPPRRLSARTQRRLRAGGLMLAGVLVYAGAVWWFATSLAEDVRAGIREVPIDTILYDTGS